ncbi:hypothetical protein NEUTE2DRAFT_121661 [Neurospora tetrasperma FGSC 2509]|nr:hypothetical protein NEUTE2DRAFT_121661 [Neurospora tetrasperma FGSC 2509]
MVSFMDGNVRRFVRFMWCERVVIISHIWMMETEGPMKLNISWVRITPFYHVLADRVGDEEGEEGADSDVHTLL